MRSIKQNSIESYKIYLINEEKSEATIEKYIRDVAVFCKWVNGREIDKHICLEYKSSLMDQYADKSVNSIISSLNSYFTFMGWNDCRIKTLKIQRQIFADTEKELSRTEYERLLRAAKKKKDERLYMLMQTICATGIRVSELKHITVEAISKRQAVIRCKGKIRTVIIPKRLCQELRRYAQRAGIVRGMIFITKSGKALNRSNIWAYMKQICELANVARSKVFPHNLRHLFAKTYYSIEHDIVRLADILGHSSINTTRIYTMESGDIHRKQIEKIGLLLC